MPRVESRVRCVQAKNILGTPSEMVSFLMMVADEL